MFEYLKSYILFLKSIIIVINGMVYFVHYLWNHTQIICIFKQM